MLMQNSYSFHVTMSSNVIPIGHLKLNKTRLDIHKAYLRRSESVNSVGKSLNNYQLERSILHRGEATDGKKEKEKAYTTG